MLVRQFIWLTVNCLWLPGLVQAAQPCLRLTGLVQDYASRQPVAARLYAQTAVGRLALGSSTQTGQFTVDITCATVNLVIECPGYRTQLLLLNTTRLPAPHQPVTVIIPLVAVDKQDRTRPYQQIEQTHYEQSRTTTPDKATAQPRHNLFTISDALSGRIVPASVCFIFTSTGQKRCLTANAAGQVQIDFPKKDIVAFEVTAPGYQTYLGNLTIDEPDGQQSQHTIQLTRELTIVSVRLSKPAGSADLRDEATGTVVPLMAMPGLPAVLISNSAFPKTYQLTVREADQAVRHQQKITLLRGLNVVGVDAKPMVSNSANEPVAMVRRPDSLPLLYFEQSSHALLPAAKAVLRQTAAYLKQNPDVKIRLVGHADREGDERQNQVLSEYRAKVVSTFLFAQGVTDAQMQLVGMGSQHLIAPSDTEKNKALNRRVQIEFLTTPAH